MQGRVRIHTNYDGMIDKIECGDGEGTRKVFDEQDSSPVGRKLSARNRLIGRESRKAYNWLRIPVWLFAGGGILGVIIHRFSILPYTIIHKLPSVHSCLVLIGLALAIQLIVLCIPVRLFQEDVIEKDAKADTWRSM